MIGGPKYEYDTHTAWRSGARLQVVLPEIRQNRLSQTVLGGVRTLATNQKKGTSRAARLQ